MLLRASKFSMDSILTGDDPNDNPYKGIMCFMIVGLKENVVFVVKDIPETGVTESR